VTCRTRRRSPFHGPRRRPQFDAGPWCYIAFVSKLLRHASIAITADVNGHLVGTIAQKAVDGAANLIAHTRGGVCLMRVSS
jgi:hypothetical protein